MKNLSFLEKPIPMETYPIKTKILTPRSEASHSYPMHWHEHIELLYFINGSGEATVGGEVIHAKKDDLIVINCNELHATQMSDDCVLFCIHISPSFFSDVDFESVLFKTHISADETVSGYLEKIHIEKKSMNEGYDMQIKGLTYLLMTYLLRNCKLEKSEILSKKKKILKISAVLKYISAYYPHKLSTAELAREFFLSEHYFCHFFKAETGMSPMGYINRFRVEKASFYLKNSNDSITEIALKVGFDDSNYFSKIFKKYRGMTPREYRALIK